MLLLSSLYLFIEVLYLCFLSVFRVFLDVCLSSKMAQFFMKMAEAVQKNTLKPGGSIPGCNSYFLCKYLKDTMLQAR